MERNPRKSPYQRHGPLHSPTHCRLCFSSNHFASNHQRRSPLVPFDNGELKQARAIFCRQHGRCQERRAWEAISGEMDGETLVVVKTIRAFLPPDKRWQNSICKVGDFQPPAAGGVRQYGENWQGTFVAAGRSHNTKLEPAAKWGVRCNEVSSEMRCPVCPVLIRVGGSTLSFNWKV